MHVGLTTTVLGNILYLKKKKTTIINSVCATLLHCIFIAYSEGVNDGVHHTPYCVLDLHSFCIFHTWVLCIQYKYHILIVSCALLSLLINNNVMSLQRLPKCRLLHKYGYLRYFRDLKNGIIITEGFVPFRKSSKEHRYLYVCNN